MRNAIVLSACLVLSSIASSGVAISQPRFVNYKVKVDPTIQLGPVGQFPGETIRLQWNRGGQSSLPAGTEVERETRVRVGAGLETVRYEDRLTSAALSARAGTDALVVPGQLANVYPDASNPARLHVNFWMPTSPLTYTDPETGNAVRLGLADVRKTNYYFELENRQTVRFPYEGLALGAVTVPIRLTRGGSEGGVEFDSRVSTSLNANVYLGWSEGLVRYQYRTHSKNEMERYGWILTPILGLSTVTANAATTSADPVPLTGDKTLGVVTVGAGLMGGYNDFEFGLFGGVDYSSPRWNYSGRPWIGIGIGYKAFKLSL